MFGDSKPALANVLRWASRPADDAEFRQFLKRRLLLYFRILGSMFAAMYVVGLVGVAIIDPSKLIPVHVHPGKVLNLAAAFVMAGFWIALRRFNPSDFCLRGNDLGAVFSISAGIGLGCCVAPSGLHLEFAILMMFIFLLVLRAALVPSTALWTAIVGVVCSVPVLLGGYQLAKRSPGGTIPGTEFITAEFITFILGVWCAAATITTTVVSHVIYGLVSQVREAQHLGQYTLREKIGEGGMGEVYRAEHAMLRRPTALKLLLPGRVSPEALERFEREVQITSRLSHPNTVIIYDYGRTPDGIFYYAMEYLDGISLEALIPKEGPQPAGRAVRVLLQVAGALAEAHGVGLIHRDVKPANIMVCDRGGTPIVKLFDFGLVKKIDTGGEQVALTNVNVITGTPLYLAPECITHEEDVDARIDIYALGALGYYLLTGGPPFEGRSVVEICSHHLHTPPEPPSLRMGQPMPPRLEALILSCLSKDRSQRPRDAQELLKKLSECEAESPFGVAEAREWWARLRQVESHPPALPEMSASERIVA